MLEIGCAAGRELSMGAWRVLRAHCFRLALPRLPPPSADRRLPRPLRKPARPRRASPPPRLPRDLRNRPPPSAPERKRNARERAERKPPPPLPPPAPRLFA